MSSHTYHPIETLCRGCLVADRKVESVELYEAEFKDLTGITISPTDGLPQWLCYECIALLKKCVGFGNKVMKSHYKLCQYVLDKIPFVSDKESRPQLSRSKIYCYEFPSSETEEQELILKTENETDLPVIADVESMQDVENIEDCHLPVITNVESMKVTPEPEISLYADLRGDVCREEENLDVASKSSCHADEELHNKENASNLERSPLPKRARRSSSSSLPNRTNIPLVQSNDKSVNNKTVEETVADDSINATLEKRDGENNGEVTVEVWCFSIDEDGELTMKSQMRQPKERQSPKPKIQATEEVSHEVINTETNATIQAKENIVDNHIAGQVDEVVPKKRGRKKKQITSTPQRDVKEGDHIPRQYGVVPKKRGRKKKKRPTSTRHTDDKDGDYIPRRYGVVAKKRGRKKKQITSTPHTDDEEDITSTQEEDDEENLSTDGNDRVKVRTRRSARYAHERRGKYYTNKGKSKARVRVNSKNKPFKCDVCKQGFASRGSLATHMPLHTRKGSFNCDVCKLSFTRKFYLNEHYRSHEKQYKCDICMKTFANQRLLDTHYTTHASVTPYKCNICVINFKFKASLNVHFRKHKNDKSYKCHICSSNFEDMSSFNEHFVEHISEKSKELKRAEDLSKGHYLIKQEITPKVDKPYKCDTCVQRFAYKHNLSAHARFCAEIHNTKIINN